MGKKAVAVAVNKGKYSQLAAKWAVDELSTETQTLLLIHVKPKTKFFQNSTHKFGLNNRNVEYMCGEDIAQGMEESYKENLNVQTKDIFSPSISYCQRKNVQCEEVIIEEDDVVKGISDFVLDQNIDVLVIGAGSDGIYRKLKGSDNASQIFKRVPHFCVVHKVGKGGIVYTRRAYSSQDLAMQNHVIILEPEIGNHLRSFDSIVEPLISAQKYFSQSTPVDGFEFRSPLINNEDSDFAWEGHSATDSDISFTCSENNLYERLLPSCSTKYSNLSIGSSDLGVSSSQRNISNVVLLRNSDSIYSSQYSMDELRKLQRELMHTRKMYEAACKEAPNALESDKNETEARINNLAKRISELQAQQTC